jgi:hypothetical protein
MCLLPVADDSGWHAVGANELALARMENILRACSRGAAAVLAVGDGCLANTAQRSTRRPLRARAGSA